MATVNFLYRSTKPQAKLNIRLLFRRNGEDVVLGAKSEIEVSADYWNNYHFKETLKDIKDLETQQYYTSEIKRLNIFLIKQFNSSDIDQINKEWLTNQVFNYYNPTATTQALSSRLSEYIDYYIKCKEIDLSNRSILKFKTIKTKIEDLEKHLKKVIQINEVNESFKNKFVEFYQLNNYSQNTMQRELSFIKTFCRHARNNGIETSIQLDGLMLQKAKVEKIYLTTEELEKIEAVKLDLEYLDNARKWLIISCYTGQRVSDFLKFNKSMIRTEDGIKLIEFTQQKTGKIMSLALHPKVQQIINSNNGEFPRTISDQKYNEYIKTVCKEAKINNIVRGGKMNNETKRKEIGDFPKHELVTSHIGRRSFATNFYGKIPTSLLISATGHSSEVLFLQYLGKSQTQQAKELAKFW